MFNFLKSLTGVILIALLGYVLYNMATQSVNNSNQHHRIYAHTTTTISGLLLANKTDCMEPGTDPRCFLRLSVGAKEVYVIYNTGENSFCTNEGAATIGKTIREGAAVKVYGFYRKDGNLDTILTCPTQNYFIQTL
jgi:hypothetical protein